MLNKEAAGRVLRKFGLALIAAMMLFAMLGAGKVYADTVVELTKEYLENNNYTLKSGEYELKADLTDLPRGIIVSEPGAQVTLKLNGHILRVSPAEDKYESVIRLERDAGKDALVTIDGGTNADGSHGKLQGGNGNRETHTYSYTVKYYTRGGGIALVRGTVVVKDVEISENTANFGGGVYLGEGGKFIMKGDSVIQENTVKRGSAPGHNGGGVFVDCAEFYMQDNATVTKNHATGDGWSGVYVGEVKDDIVPDAELKVDLTGNAVIFTNTPEDAEDAEEQYQNLILSSNGTDQYGNFQIDVHDLGDNAKIGVNMRTPGRFTTLDSQTARSDMTKFYSDNDEYVIIRTTEDKLELKKRSEIEEFYQVGAYKGSYNTRKHGIEISLKEGVKADLYFGKTVGDLEKADSSVYAEFKDVGKYTVYYQIVPERNYPWIVDSQEVVIEPRDINKADIKLEDDELDYTRAEQEPKLIAQDYGKKIAEDQYVISYQQDGEALSDGKLPKEPGAYTMVIKAAEEGNYTGEKEIGFTIVVPVPHFYKKCSLTLGGSIGVKFFLSVPEQDYYDYSESVLTFSVEHEDKARTIPFDRESAVVRTLGDEKYYEYVCYVNAVQMADTITATFSYKFEGEDKKETLTNSVKNYVERVETLEDKDYPAKARALVQSLADYGHHAQQYLSSIRGWKIGDDHTEMDKFYTESYSDETIEAAAEALKGKDIQVTRSSRISNLKYSLYLDSDTAIYLYFKPAANYTGGAEATVNGVKTTVYQLKDGRFKVVIPNIAAHRLGNTYSVVMNNGGYKTTVEVSAMSYVKAILESSKKAEEKNAMMAIYKYYTEAMNYIA